MSAWPAGYHHDRGDRFERARRALMEWAPQLVAGIRVYPGDPVAEGVNTLPAIGLDHGHVAPSALLARGDQPGFAASRMKC